MAQFNALDSDISNENLQLVGAGMDDAVLVGEDDHLDPVTESEFGEDTPMCTLTVASEMNSRCAVSLLERARAS